LEYELLEGGHLGTPLRRQWDHALTVRIYAEDDFNLTPKLTLVAGGRMDYSRHSIDGFTSTSLEDATAALIFFWHLPENRLHLSAHAADSAFWQHQSRLSAADSDRRD
jgi:hypothetical protein